jgi:hypothetical protein
MATYASDLGLLYPTEGGFKRPGAYGEFLIAQGSLRQQYLTELDKLFASLAQEAKKFDEQMKVEREKMELQRELKESEQEFEKWKIGEYTKLERLKANAMNRGELGGVTSRELFNTLSSQFDKRMSMTAEVAAARQAEAGKPKGGYASYVDTGEIRFPSRNQIAYESDYFDDYYGRRKQTSGTSSLSVLQSKEPELY